MADSTERIAIASAHSDGRGRDLFIVDNSVSGWTGLRYLEDAAGVRL